MKKQKRRQGLLALVTVAAVLFSQFAFAAGNASSVDEGGNSVQNLSEQNLSSSVESSAPAPDGPESSTDEPESSTDEPESSTDGPESEDSTFLPERDLFLANDEYRVVLQYKNESLAEVVVKDGETVPDGTFDMAESKLQEKLQPHDAFQEWRSAGKFFPKNTQVHSNLTLEPYIQFARTVSFYASADASEPLKVFTVLDGQKLSQAVGGYTQPDEPANSYNGAAFRWVDPNYSNNAVTGDKIISGKDYKIYPKWTYSVTYDATSGTVTPSSQEVEASGYVTLPTPVYQVKGDKDPSGAQFATVYEFLGWDQGDGGELLKGGTRYTPSANNIKLVAKWGPAPGEKFTVTFLLKGEGSTGSDVITITNVAKNAKIISFPSVSGGAGQGYTGTWKDQKENILSVNAQVKEDLILTPVFSSESFFVYFMVGNAAVDWCKVPYGQTIPASEIPPDPEPIKVEVDVENEDGTTSKQTVSCAFLYWVDSEGEKWDLETRQVLKEETLRAVFNIPGGGGGGTPTEICIVTIYPNPDDWRNSYEKRIPKGSKLTPPDTPKNKEDYDFKWWSSANEYPEEFDFNTSITEDMELFSVWEKRVHVTFNSDGGSHIGVVTVSLNEKVPRPEDPVKRGYQFKGWSQQRQDGQPVEMMREFSFDTPIDEWLAGRDREITLWAWYESDTKVVFHYNNKEDGIRPEETIETVVFNEGDHYVVPYRVPQDTAEHVVVPQGAVFTGWFHERNEPVKAGDPITIGKTLHLYAKWDRGFKITYVTSPTNFSPDEAGQYQKTFVSYPANTMSITPPPTYDAAAKKWVPKWYLEKNFATEVNFSDIGTVLNGASELTVYGKWETAPDNTTYTVIFHPNGGALNKRGEAPVKDPNVVQYTVKLGEKSEQPEYRGEEETTFGGWYLDPECLQSADLEQPVVEDMEVYARWVYEIKFVARKSTAPDQTHAVKYAVKNGTVSRPGDPSLADLTFGGWTRTPETGGDALWDFWNGKVNGNMTLYGAWQAVVTFDTGGGKPVPEDVNIWVDNPNTDRTIIRPIDPKIEGDNFLGWYHRDDTPFHFRGEDGAEEIAINTTLFAKYEKFEPPEPDTYTLTIDGLKDGGILKTPLNDGGNTGHYEAGEQIVIEVDAQPGYEFIGWKQPDAGTVGNLASTEITFTMPGQDVTLIAQFRKLPPDQYTLTISGLESGGILKTPLNGGGNTGHYEAGATVEIEVEPQPGYAFAGWEEPEAGTIDNLTSAKITFTMPGQDVTLVAQFRKLPPDQYTLTISGLESGGILKTPLNGGGNTGHYEAGATVEIEVEPQPGYAFAGWEEPEAGTIDNLTSAKITFTMPGQDVTLVARFRELPPDQYTLTVLTGSGGSLKTPLNGGGNTGHYEAEEQIVIEVEPQPGYEFTGWQKPEAGTIDDLTSAKITFTMPGQDVTLVALFRQVTPPGKTYKLQVNGLNSGGRLLTPLNSGEKDNVGYYAEGTKVEIEIRPLDGYRFLGWLPPNQGSISDVNSAKITFTMPGKNAVIVAQFQKIKKNDIVSSGSSGGSGRSSGGGGAARSLLNGSRDTGDVLLGRRSGGNLRQVPGNTADTRPAQPPVTYNLDGSGTLGEAGMQTLLEQNAERDVELKRGDFTFRFAQGTMRPVPGKTAYDFGATFDVGENHGRIANLAGDALALTVHYNYDGPLPAEAEISIEVGRQYAGQTLYYYYFNPETEALEYLQSVTVNEEGTVTVRQSHCSDYALLTVNLYEETEQSARQSETVQAPARRAGGTASAAAANVRNGAVSGHRTLPPSGERFPLALALAGGAALISSLTFLRKFQKERKKTQK